MNTLNRPFYAQCDELLLSGYMLEALELGRLPMYAGEYADLAATAAAIIDTLPAAVAAKLLQEGHTVLSVIAENSLHDRGETAWVTDPEGLGAASATWNDLQRKLRVGTRQ